jgi:hypothetical protein
MTFGGGGGGAAAREVRPYPPPILAMTHGGSS